MEKKKRRLPSAGIVIAVVALVAALTGTAIAGPDAFTSISKNKTKKIANKQSKKQINKQTPWSSDDIATDAISSSKLSDEAVKADELGEISKVEETSPPAAVPPINATADCPSDTKVISGGFKVTAADPDPDATPIPTGDQRSNNGWAATAIAQTEGDTVTAYAYCLEESG